MEPPPHWHEDLKNALTIGKLRLKLADLFRQSLIPDPDISTTLLLTKALSVQRSNLPLIAFDPVPRPALNELLSLVKRRLSREPLQYILGKWHFFDFEVDVAQNILIPRPETEDIFCHILPRLRERWSDLPFRFVDVGTGTGILSIALARTFTNAIGTAVDLCKEPVTLAKQNFEKHAPQTDALTLVQSDLLSCFQNDTFNLIISNPPYIPTVELTSLQPEVSEFEPRTALDGGEDGLHIIKQLLQQSARVLQPTGLLIIEHGHGQRKNILSLPAPTMSVIETADDAAHKERLIIWQKN